MRLIILSLYILLGSSFVACSDKKEDDDNNNLELTTDYFNQSSWTGDYIYKDKQGKIKQTIRIGFTFISDKTGKFTRYKNDPDDYNTDHFSYAVDKRRLILTRIGSNQNTSLGIDWFVIEKSRNNIVLVQDLATDLDTKYLYLKRDY